MVWGASGVLRMQSCRINLAHMFIYDSRRAAAKRSAAVIELARHTWHTRDGYDKNPTCVCSQRCHPALGVDPVVILLCVPYCDSDYRVYHILPIMQSAT